ncbi:hypothetical protein CCMSSC00406_0005516 [Pleurotus cornucopiae]|uniref:Uncharacterized protein n=1 Tax=Pleurotus cornucopiae TaxID=5321 RepID=A0ACB7ISF1_PLECO|nr:hypothetical protein CCMSSC00406_0005516 [Pleurotus cornucopiae]
MQQVHPRARVHRSKTDGAAAMGGQRHAAHQYQHARRTEPSPHTHYPAEEAGISSPWQHMAQNYAWVTEQEFVKHEKQTGKKTNKWILEDEILISELHAAEGKGASGGKTQTSYHHAEVNLKGSRPPLRRQYAYPWPADGERWEEVLCAYEIEADRWMREQEQARRLAMERERIKNRVLQEEYIRREAAHQRQRQKEAEKRLRMEEERMRRLAALREQERKERAQADKATVDAWREYEERWKALASQTDPLTFASIPWPVVLPPTTPTGITSAAIVLFLYSPLHSPGQSRKDRIRHAQLRWHPDRFRKVLERVAETDREAVEEGVGIVARCLNDLMAREAVASRHQVSLTPSPLYTSLQY